ENLLHPRQVDIGALVFDEGTIVTEVVKAGGDRLAGLGMEAHLTWKRQQLQRVLKFDGVCIDAPGGIGALWLLLVSSFAKLHVGSEAYRAQRDGKARLGIVAQHLAIPSGFLLCQRPLRTSNRPISA